MAQQNRVIDVPAPESAPAVSLETILKHEALAKGTYGLSEMLYNDEPLPAD
jgi:hypothetical protein